MPRRNYEFRITADSYLLEFLLDNIPGSRNTVKNLLKLGFCAVDGEKVTQFDLPLSVGQVLTVSDANAARAALPFPIIYEDDRIIVINKKAGLLTIANEKERNRTAYRMVSDYVKAGNPGSRIFIIHRLDRDTSGVVMFAKDEATKRAYQDRWDELVQKRGYVAVCEGRFDRDSGELVSYLRESREHEVYICEKGERGAKMAVTKYRVIRAGSRFSLLDIEITTGRKNQIRVQLAGDGHPVCGDKRYGSTCNPHGRLSLHASELILRSPFDGHEQRFTAPIPKAFYKLG